MSNVSSCDSPVYIHYGAKKFNPSRNFPVKNNLAYVSAKPVGGLWASRENASWGWKQWCENNDFGKCNESNSFKFRLKDGCNIFIIHLRKELETLPEKDWLLKLCLGNCYYIDFEKCIEMGIDAIELCWYGEEYNGQAEDNMYYALYGWDCDSILVLNPDIVEEV